MTLIPIAPAKRRQSVRSADSADSTRASVSPRGEIHTLRPPSSAQDLVDQFRTFIEEVRWQRADALILALQDHPLKSILWAVIGEALASMPAAKRTADGRAAS